MFCVFVVVAGNAFTEQGWQVETSLLSSQSISVLIYADATQDFTTFLRVLSRYRRGKISLLDAMSVKMECHCSISVSDADWGVGGLMDT